MPNAVATAIIADDEPHLARYLRERLAAAWPELEIAGVATNGSEARALIDAESPDVAFLDIRMPGLTGLDVARDLRGVDVVFVTAYDQYALAAFERAAVDYLLKPVTDERLAATVARLRERWRTRSDTARVAPSSEVTHALELLREYLPGLAGSASAPRLAWVRAAVGGNVRLIAVADVCYFEANDKYTSVFTAHGEALIRTPLKELLAQLDPERFWQIHRGTIVNVEHIDTTSRDIAGRVRVKLRARPETLAVSRAFAYRFKQM